MTFEERLTDLFTRLKRNKRIPQGVIEPTAADLAASCGEMFMQAPYELYTERLEAMTDIAEEHGEINFFALASTFASESLNALWKIFTKTVGVIDELRNQAKPSIKDTQEICLISFRVTHVIWESIPNEKRTDAGLKHPLAPLIEGYLNPPIDPDKAKVLVTAKHSLARIPNRTQTVALATWEKLPCVVIVEVDGEPMASKLCFAPRRPIGPPGQSQLRLPGLQSAIDLRLALLRDIDRERENDRRNPIRSDTWQTLAIGSAITTRMTLHVDQLGALIAGRLKVPTRNTEKKTLRARAWAVVGWVTLSMPTPRGHWLPILAIDYGRDLPEGHLRIWPYNWEEQGHGYRLTGTLTKQKIRAEYKGGSLTQLAAGIEDYLGASGQMSTRDRTPRLLVPTKPGGPGTVSEFITYPQLLAQSGFFFDWRDPKQRNAAKSLWRRLQHALKERGYVLDSPENVRAEARAGDTFEIVEIVTGTPRGGFGGLRIRASARMIEAHSLLRRGNDHGLGLRSLPALFSH